MERHQDDDLDQALEIRCRKALSAHRADAFDNIDVARFLGRERLSREDARWIARHLMENGRALAAYSEGQAILAEAGHAG